MREPKEKSLYIYSFGHERIPLDGIPGIMDTIIVKSIHQFEQIATDIEGPLWQHVGFWGENRVFQRGLGGATIGAAKLF